MSMWTKSPVSRGNSRCKGPEAAVFPEHLRSNKEASVVGAQGARGQPGK